MNADRTTPAGGDKRHHGQAAGGAVADPAGLMQKAWLPIDGGLVFCPGRSHREQLKRQVPQQPIGHDHQFINPLSQHHFRLPEQHPFHGLSRRPPVSLQQTLGGDRGVRIVQPQGPQQQRDLARQSLWLCHLPEGRAIC